MTVDLPHNTDYRLQPVSVQLAFTSDINQTVSAEYHFYDVYKTEVAGGSMPVTIQPMVTTNVWVSFVPPAWGWYHIECFVKNGTNVLAGGAAHVGLTPRFPQMWTLCQQQSTVDYFEGWGDGAKDGYCGLGFMRVNTSQGTNFIEECLATTAAHGEILMVQFVDTNWTVNAKVADVVNHFKGRVKYWEVINEPNNNMSVNTYTAILAQVSATVKSIDPAAQVVGPCVCTIDLGWLQQFFIQGGGQYVDIISVHDYEGHQSIDPGHWTWKMGMLYGLMRMYGQEQKPVWQTERAIGDVFANNFQAGCQAVRETLHRDILSTLGVPNERNHLYYMNFTGYDSVPTYIWSDSGPHATALALRTREAMIRGRNYAEELDFGPTGNKMFMGLRYSGTDGDTIILRQLGGQQDPNLVLGVNGGGSVMMMDSFGNAQCLPIQSGNKIALTVPPLPVYLRLTPGQTIVPPRLDYGANYAQISTNISYSSTNNSGNFYALTNGIFENTHNSSPWGPYWSGDLAIAPQTLDISFSSPQTVNRTIVYSVRADDQYCTLLNFDLQYYSNSTWTTLQSVTTPCPASDPVVSRNATASTWYKDQNFSLVQFPQVITSRLRIRANHATIGFEPDAVSQTSAGFTPGPTNLNLREIEIYNYTNDVKFQRCDVETPIPLGSVWKYLANGTDQGTGWRTNGFNDSAWSSGTALLGYGLPGDATVVGYGGNANNKYITTYFRKTFVVTNAANYLYAKVGLVKADGAVIYINGVEALRDNMPQGTVTASTLASAVLSGGSEGFLNQYSSNPGSQIYSVSPGSLVNGTNVLAVEVHLGAANGVDMGFDLQLVLQQLEADLGSVPSASMDSFNFTSGTACSVCRDKHLVPFGSTWKYLDDGSNQGTAWQANGFDDSAWKYGPAKLGYGNGDEATLVGCGHGPFNKNFTTYFRKQFIVTCLTNHPDMRVQLLRNDGGIVYLNGHIILWSDMGPGPTNYPVLPGAFTNWVWCNPGQGPSTCTTPASNMLTGADAAYLDELPVNTNFLVLGTNVLAVEIHKFSIDQWNSTMGFDLSLADLELAPNPDSGIANSPPTVDITSPIPGTSFSSLINITISATAADSDGTITRVDFYNGATKLGDSGANLAGPYTFVWSNVMAGSYSLTAKAVDNDSATTTSAAVGITVNAPTGGVSTTQFYDYNNTGYTIYATNNLLINSVLTVSNAGQFVTGDPTMGTNDISVLTNGTCGVANPNGDCPKQAVCVVTPSGLATGLLTFAFNTSAYPAGYSVNSIVTYAGWQDNGRSAQNYTVAYSTVGAPNVFNNIATVSYSPPATTPSCDRVTIINTSGTLATNVAAVRFSFGNQENGYAAYKELMVFGSAMNSSLNLSGNIPSSAWMQQYYPGTATNNYASLAASVASNGMTVWQDYLAGINPTNPKSCFSLVITNAAGHIVVSVPSVQTNSCYSGVTRYYSIEQCTNMLIGGSWQAIPGYTGLQASGGIIACTNAANSVMFYRAEATLQ